MTKHKFRNGFKNSSTGGKVLVILGGISVVSAIAVTALLGLAIATGANIDDIKKVGK
jgi:hypothetical protein